MAYQRGTVKALVESLSPGERQEVLQLLSQENGAAGGHARAKRLTPERRSEIARQAAAARWRNE